MVQPPSTYVCHSRGSWQAAVGTGRSIFACAGLTALRHFVLRTSEVQPRLALALTDHATDGVQIAWALQPNSPPRPRYNASTPAHLRQGGLLLLCGSCNCRCRACLGCSYGLWQTHTGKVVSM